MANFKEAILKMAFVSLVFKTFVEGHFNDFMNIVTEARIRITDKEISSIDSSFIGFSISLLFVKLLSILLMICFSVKSSSMFHYLHDGLRPSKRSKFYFYTHFLLFRILFAIFILTA